MGCEGQRQRRCEPNALDRATEGPVAPGPNRIIEDGPAAFCIAGNFTERCCEKRDAVVRREGTDEVRRYGATTRTPQGEAPTLIFLITF